MRITRHELRRIIREAIQDEPIRQIPGDSFSPKALKDLNRRFRDYSKKGVNSYKTVITMSPEGDSVIVDGIETYIDDVPQQLEILSGFPMKGNDADNLIFALEEMVQDGYVELSVSYEDGHWGW